MMSYKIELTTDCDFLFHEEIRHFIFSFHMRSGEMNDKKLKTKIYAKIFLRWNDAKFHLRRCLHEIPIFCDEMALFM